jgi:hypothetical protein
VLGCVGTRHAESRADFAYGQILRLFILATSLTLTASTLTPNARAEPAPQPQFGWREVWAGSDVTKDVWLLYTGVTLAPWSKDIYTNGWRIRSASGYGEYTFPACAIDDPDCDTLDEGTHKHRTKFKAQVTYGEVLLGYHHQFGDLTAKAFAGVSIVQQNVRPSRKSSLAHGVEYGAKGALEFWLNIGPDAWSSLDVSYSTAFETGAARWRLGWRALPTVSIGPELRFDSNVDGRSGRAGLFARYEWMGGEISVAAGAAGRWADDFADDLEPYATLNVLFQF